MLIIIHLTLQLMILFILNDAIKEFYTFEGWYESELFTGSKVVELSGVSKDVTLWAKWSLNEYSVSYVNSGDVNNLEIITAETVDLSLNDATKTNYTFEGWYTESYFVNEVKSLSLDLLVDDEITLYANYSLSIYKDDVTEQEYVFYGSYPQTLISDISGLDSSEYVSLDNKYFKVEPIRWNIVMEENGVAMLISDIILDACKYDDEIIDFDYSYIKEFLNNSFYNTAFNNEEKENIIVQTNNTYTKVTLISNSQFETNKDKLKYNGYSDYSEVNNLVIHPATKATMYWTLSRTVDNEKNMHIITNSDALSSTSVITTTYGVRPTITINL